MTLTDFLLARIDEDESGARGAEAHSPSPWLIDAYSSLADANHKQMARFEHPRRHTTVGFIAWNHPARVLRECEAKRRILAEHESVVSNLVGDMGCFTCVDSGGDPVPGPCVTLRLLAAVYRSHPDYQQEWAP